MYFQNILVKVKSISLPILQMENEYKDVHVKVIW